MALESDNHLGIAHGTVITLQDSRLTAEENPSENISYRKSSDRLDLVGSNSDSESDSDSSEGTNKESNDETSEEEAGKEKEG